MTLGIVAFFERTAVFSKASVPSCPLLRSLLQPSCSPFKTPASGTVLRNSQRGRNLFKVIAVLEESAGSLKHGRIENLLVFRLRSGRLQMVSNGSLRAGKSVGQSRHGHALFVKTTNFRFVFFRQSSRTRKPLGLFRAVFPEPAPYRVGRNPVSDERRYFLVAVSLFGQCENSGFRFGLLTVQSSPFRRDCSHARRAFAP